MKAKKYTKEQREWFVVNMKAMGPEYVSKKIIEQCADAFNDQFGDNRSVTAIAAQFRLVKTNLNLPVKIAFTELSNPRHGISKRAKRLAMARKLDKAIGMVANIPKITDRIPAMMSELEIAFRDLIRQNKEMKDELKKLADVRSAIDKYRNGR